MKSKVADVLLVLAWGAMIPALMWLGAAGGSDLGAMPGGSGAQGQERRLPPGLLQLDRTRQRVPVRRNRAERHPSG